MRGALERDSNSPTAPILIPTTVNSIPLPAGPAHAIFSPSQQAVELPWPTAGCVEFQLCPFLLKASPTRSNV